MTTTTETLYYICRSTNVHIGIFGTADQCAKWYLRYDGADYCLYRKAEMRAEMRADMPIDSTEGPVVRGTRSNEGAGRVWNVAFRVPGSTRYREALITVTGEDEQAADNALRSYVLQCKLLATRNRDENFYMVEAEHALPGLIRAGEMHAIYDLSQRPTISSSEVRQWFWNADHTEKALLKMVDVIAARRYLPLPWLAAAQLRAQVSARVRDAAPIAVCHGMPREALLLH